MKKGIATQKSTVKELSEKELSEKLEASKLERQKRAIEEINGVLKKHNCVMKTDIDVVLNGKHLVKPIVIAK